MQLQMLKNKLRAITALGRKTDFDFPAAALSLKGRRIEARTPAGPVKTSGKRIVCTYRDGGVTFEVKVYPGRGEWFFKELVIKSDAALPTPDYVELDRQKIPAGGMTRRGYMVTAPIKGRPGSDEEGGGLMPGCGYPVMGKRIFAGIEHPAAFNSVDEDGTWTLRQHPVWQGNVIRCRRAVVGLGDDPEALFYDYLATVRLPPLKKTLVSFCSFWSDPYIGNYEYDVRPGNYTSLVEAFSALGLRPDVYTLDAGWQDRRSFFDAKEAFGGNKGLKKVAALFRRHGAELSLWVSHNGPMGMDWDFLGSQGIAVGAGESSTYCGDHYGVLLDPKLEAALKKRFCELASPEYGAVHFKIDWDNDCATTPEFAEVYPTRDHVREGSIDAMIRISDAMRKVNPHVVIRNGWWPSPWWLMSANHVFLADSGDSEYATFPALTQRASAANHRDLMYYIELRRDGSLIPPDAFDNHEFPHARRNPFVELPGDWCDTCVWCVLRGASYMPMTLQPESLEKWQAEILGQALAFARNNAAALISGRSRMIGGNPNAGEIYGFAHPAPDGDGVWLALRNPAPFCAEYKIAGDLPELLQVYPCWQRLEPEEKLTFAPHEVKLILCSQKRIALPAETPFMVCGADKGGASVILPAAARPGVAEVYTLPELVVLKNECRFKEESTEIELGLRIPYRMRVSTLCLRIGGAEREKCRVTLRTSRYGGWHKVSSYTLPAREVFPGSPGCGERKNPDMTAIPAARFFVFDIPQGGEDFLNLEITGAKLAAQDLSLWYSGRSGPARAAEKRIWKCRVFNGAPPPAHPEGFPLNKKLL